MNGIILSLLMLGAVSEPAELRVGVARKIITPDGPIWMAGFVARNRPSEGVVHDLWAKALALQDARRHRVVIVATDLLSLPREISDEVAARVKKKYGLERSQLMLNSTHTHSGPVFLPNPIVGPDIDPLNQQRLVRYRRRLIDALVEVVGASLADMAPATLAVGHGSAPFTMNRREHTSKGIKLGVNPAGPVDRDVPVLTVATPEGKLRAVVFGYACHNTTVGGDGYQIHGDYAGFAQLDVEKALPGTTAMFLQLCGADQNPYPRRKLELAAQHGKTLADAVERVLAGTLQPVHPAIRTAFEVVRLDFARQDRAVFEQELKSTDRFRKRRAEAVLAALDAGRPVWQVPVPVQAVGFGDNLVMLALGGEVVVDYSLRLKREYPHTNLIVAAYSNDVACYIPSRRMRSEGGYEVISSMVFYAQPGPFAESVEETMIGACHRLLATVGAKASAKASAAVGTTVDTTTKNMTD